MTLTERYIEYISHVRRYSARTQDIYSDVLRSFTEFAFSLGTEEEAGISDKELKEALTPEMIRGYEIYLLEERKDSPRTVNLHLSVLSGFCRFLISREELASNPAKSVSRPRTGRRLPEFYRHDVMEKYFADTDIFISTPASVSLEEFTSEYIRSRTRTGYSPERDSTVLTLEKFAGHPDRFRAWLYRKRLGRVIISTLYSTGIRRAELISLNTSSIDFSRQVMRVHGKGDKMREIPVISSLCEEISLYLQTVSETVCGKRDSSTPLFVTIQGKRLYPVSVDRAVKEGLGDTGLITSRKSPHVLRHTLATELLDNGTDLNSIKELLGHSSLAATEVYTHNSIAKLKKVYETAHPRAKSGGKHGD